MKSQKEIEAIIEENARLKEQLEQKNEQILQLQRQLYGRRSEKQLPQYKDAEPNLFSLLEGEEMLEEEKQILTSVIEEVTVEAKKRRDTTKEQQKHIARKYKLPSDLRREEVTVEPEGVDLSTMVKIGEDVCERLMYKPAEFWVKRIIRPIYRPKVKSEDLSTAIYQHPQLHNILMGCMADNSLLSQIIIDKFQHHLPEHRQKERFKALGMNLTPSTINRWVHKVADKMYLLYKLQMNQVLDCDYIQVDETTQKIKDREGKARNGYIWAVRNVITGEVFYYYYKGSRSQEVILKLLVDYQGALQTDGYAAYSIYEDKKGVLPLGCMAHVRRKFENALATTPEAQEVLDYIMLLYTIESNLRARGANRDEIRQEREAKSYPLLQAMERLLLKLNDNYNPKSLMGKAISYTFGMLPRISRYCKDGLYEIDNNAIERAVRPIAVGRKNYLFSANDKGAEDNTVFYTFITSCKELGIEPIEWFNYVMARITEDTTEEQLKELLPMNYKKMISR